ncbi:MAG: molybdopterin oxidoreductase [Deltaproteobacteria bacterium CG11_big_fil_rev_8_21_14_0_20_42_23]|nr:MAG: molybdopterin oxidoreductase [Deltaproteobacteria bacterium CG11_big_fil_rev_8_21_14_0_20_42_23]PJC65076.1 MAG: molybdopterin oxidoreductase [Deltaproteobacteria bacterium CG_4_9_14_0_2_um_filter_42_21]
MLQRIVKAVIINMKKNVTFWKSIEELEQTAEFEARTGKEFAEPPQKAEMSGMERRDFLKVMAASIAMAGAACTRRPVEKIMPYINKPEGVIPGVPVWYASSFEDGSSSYAVLVRTREGRPVKLEPNVDAPLNATGLSARAQASLLDLYHPDRIKAPSFVQNGTLKESNWEDLDKHIIAKLDAVKKTGGKIRVLTGVSSSPTTQKVLRSFENTYNAASISYDSVFPNEMVEAAKLSYGKSLLPRYRFEEAKVIVSFGADFLGNWMNPVRNMAGFSEGRNVDAGKMSRFIAFESVPTVTGTNADMFVPVKAGDEIFVALSLAYEVARRTGNASVASSLRSYAPEKLESKINFPASHIVETAEELVASRGTGLVVGANPNAKDAVLLQVAVNFINSTLANDGVTLDWTLAPRDYVGSSFEELKHLVAEMHAGEVEVLIVADADPLFTLPAELNCEEALKKVGLVISCADYFTATSAQSHVVCPGTHYLEAWGDANPERGLYTLVQPVIAPLHQGRSCQDSLLHWSGSESNYHEVLKHNWKSEVLPRVSSSLSWKDALKMGFVDAFASKRNDHGRIASAETFNPSALKNLPQLSSSAELSLALYPSLSLYDGRNNTNSWLLELPDPVTKLTWENVVSLSLATATKLSLREGDVVKVKSETFSAELPVHIQPKLHDATAAVALGFAAPHGMQVYPFQSYAHQTPSWNGIKVELEKTGKTALLACTQGHHELENRAHDIFSDATWKEFQHNPHAGIKKHAELPSMWEERKYEGHRWGMVIDTNACTGCSACVVACQAENNIPVVGKEQVIRGREMHWIRIDRYYSSEKGKTANPNVSHQPMTCQQCSNAPCETVCPTLATFHSDDGLNMMSYNRCVGTRYCANNCPYKVRRFNFFEQTLSIKEPMNQVLNPDITTRSRGVMEKCTFCIQRIQEKRNDAIIEKRELKDGEIKTACQQTCPAQAITFGDLNMKESQVAKMAASQRGYHVLAELNTRPVVTYLTKIRNV